MNKKIPKTLVLCKECNKEFYVRQAVIKRGYGKYCSIKCFNKDHCAIKVKVECKECRKNFLTRPILVKYGFGKYCSKECYRKEHSRRMSGKNNSMFDIRRYGKESPHFKGGLIKVICKECKKEFLVKPSCIKYGKGLYCSTVCKNKACFKGGRAASYKRQYKKIKNTPHLRLRSRVSILIGGRLKKRLLSKNRKSTFSFLPYTVDELKQHLENQFEPWMNWGNWSNKAGYWTIHHIKADSLFNYTSVEDKEFQECWALKNLMPLEFIENVKRSNKII